MHSPASIRIEQLSKYYRLGLTHTGSIRELVNGLWRSATKRITNTSTHCRKPHTTNSSSGFWALRDIALNVQQGEVLGIIGRNGAGKSTMLKILSQVTSPTTGEIHLLGRVGSLLEVGTGFHPELTGRENIFMNGTILGMKRAEILRKLDEIIAFSGVEQFIDTPVKRYSSGMTVRLGFSVAAHLEPEILIVDEVLAVGDFEFQKKCLGKMEHVSNQGRTILFVSHNMGAIRSLCSRAVLLQQGKLVDDGDPATVINRYVQSTTPESDNCLPPDAERSGTGEARFRGVTSNRPATQLDTPFLMYEPIPLLLSVEVFEQVENVHFQLFVTTPDGQVITCSETTSRPYQPTTLEVGHLLVQVEIDARLLPGDYRVNATILRGDGAEIDIVENAMAFSIDRAGTEDGEFFRWNQVIGYIRPEATWKFSQPTKTL